MTIYIVTSGEYSDYGIDSIFLNKEIADAYAASKNKMGSGYLGYNVEEFETMDETPFKREHELKKYWSAEITLHPAKTEVEVTEGFTDDYDRDNAVYPDVTAEQMEDRVRYDMRTFGNKTKFEYYYGYASATSDVSAEHAKKRLFDHIAKQKAIFEGITI